MILQMARDHAPDLILSIQGSCITAETVQRLKETTSAPLLNYSTDNPFNPSASTPYVQQSLPLWDVYATPRAHTIPELKRHCKGMVTYLPFGYDPALHFPESGIAPLEALRFSSDLVFIGTCDSDRVKLLKFLASQTNFSVRLYGGGRRYKLVKALRANHRGFAEGRDYRLALTCSKICLSMMRRCNRDTHVMRTFEIPACGAFMLAERTEEQCEMFAEDRECVFFSTPEELLDKASYYLKHDEARRKIARAGFDRVTSGGNSYRHRLATLLERVAMELPVRVS
jgi:spore maturation protein CgeB